MEKKMTKSYSRDFPEELFLGDTDEDYVVEGDEEEDEEEELRDDSAVSSEDVEEDEDVYEEIIECTLHRPVLKTRRTVAENLKYNLTYVQPLRNKALDAIVLAFEQDPIDLDGLPPDDLDYVIDNLSLDLPLEIVASRIECESYWERRSKKYFGERFKYFDINDYDGSYKRLFFESYLQEKITSFIPRVDDLKALQKECAIGGRYVQRLYLHQLLTPVGTGNSDGRQETLIESQIDSMNLEEVKFKEPVNGHVNFAVLGTCFPGLEDLELKYCVENCGLNFDWSMFYCTTWDCQSLCRMLLDTNNITRLSVNHSRLDDVKVEILASNLPRIESLGELSLAHNSISDDGARFISKYLDTNPSLTSLDLGDNNIHYEGALAIFYSLVNNGTLTRLNLKINLIGPKIAEMFVRSLSTNTTLKKLSLSANGLNDDFLETVFSSADDITGLVELDLSANPDITELGALSILRGLLKNEVIMSLDLHNGRTFGDISHCIEQKLEANRAKKAKNVNRIINKIRNIYRLRRNHSRSIFSTISDVGSVNPVNSFLNLDRP